MASEQQAANVVTSENLAEWQAQRLGLMETPPEAQAEAPEAEQEAVEADEHDEAEEGQQEPKAENDTRPDATKYTDIEQYAADLEAWKERDVKRSIQREAAEAKAKSEQEARVKSWNERLRATQGELPDFADVVQGSPVQVGDHIRDAILESEVGPKLLYHLAQNPDIADKFRGMSVASGLRELGKIEARLEKAAEKPAETPIAAISKAPPPITPVKGGKSSPDVPIDANGEFTGTPAQYRALRRSGKIR